MTTPKPRSAEYFDGWYASKSDAPQVAEIMNRNLGLPPDALAGIVPAVAIDEIAAELRLKPGDVLLDLACGRAFYGLEITARAGARLIGVDFSAEAVRQAAEQARLRNRDDAEFQTGDLTATGLPDGSVNAVLCTDSIQFPEQPEAAYRELRRVLVPGGRVVLTSWQPVDPGDQRLSERIRRVDLGAGLGGAASSTLKSATARSGWPTRWRSGRRRSRSTRATIRPCSPSTARQSVRWRIPPPSAGSWRRQQLPSGEHSSPGESAGAI